MDPVRPAVEDLPAREPVWQALADMFLDTDVTLSRHWRAAQLARSPYSIEALEHILVDEVQPVCKVNLLSVAGEWAGFDPDWLRTRILRRAASPFRCLHALHPGRRWVRLSAEWQATRAAIVVARSAAASPRPCC